MDIRQAILKAADYIERNPSDFDFGIVVLPTCGSPGCALGWIGCFLGCTTTTIDPFGSSTSPVAMLGLECQQDFYDRMRDLMGNREWHDSAQQCAHRMRLYADKYHPAPNSFDIDPAFAKLRDSIKTYAEA